MKSNNSKTEAAQKKRIAVASAVLLCLVLSVSRALWAEDDMVRFIERKQAELNNREDAVKREEERMAALLREVEERIEKYTKLLAQIEKALNKLEQVKNERLDSIVKSYESMPPEDAAARITSLDHETAVSIMQRMKSRKAGAVMAAMQPAKAAELTKALASLAGRR